MKPPGHAVPHALPRAVPLRLTPGVVRLLYYGCALGAGLWIVLGIFPRDLLLHGVVPDVRVTGDVAQHVVGQRAFLQDSWHWPLLRTTMLDAPGGLNVAMTDANPLVMLPLKLVGALLPQGFSAIQLWLALAYLLQPLAAVFALRSAGETRVLPAAVVSLFAVSMPTFLYRHPHSALSSHFLLLLALASYFHTTRALRGRDWLPIALLPTSFLIHPYLAFMTMAVLTAAPATLLLRADRRWLHATVVLACAVALTVALVFLLGYEAAPPSGGYGEVSMNALSPIFPTYSRLVGRGLGFVDATGSQYEGYQFLGVGLLALLPCCVVAACLSTRTRFLQRNWGLVLASVALTALALSSVVYVGTHKVLDIHPVPTVFHQLRASGRLFWPVAYILMVGAVATIARIVPRPLAYALLAAAAALQVSDARDLRHTMARDLRARTAPVADQALLDTLVSHHARMTLLPTFGCGANAVVPEFMPLLLAASRLRVAVNTMYVARFAELPACAVADAAAAPLAAGELRVFLAPETEAGPAVVPDSARVCRTLATMSVCTLQTGLLAGLAPVAVPVVPLGHEIATAAPLSLQILGPGWYMPEPTGVWSIEHDAVLAARLEPPPPGGVTLEVLAQGFTGVHATSQPVALSVNGHPVAQWSVLDREDTRLRAVIPHADLVDGPQVLRLDIPGPARPSETGVNTDTRQLGVFLKSVRFEATPAS